VLPRRRHSVHHRVGRRARQKDQREVRGRRVGVAVAAGEPVLPVIHKVAGDVTRAAAGDGDGDGDGGEEVVVEGAAET
jgi:hypothetical protein